jgi:kinesin family protein 18/19
LLLYLVPVGKNRQNQNGTVLKMMKSEQASSLHQNPEDGETNEYLKQMWAGQSNILVAVRVRPLMKHDQIKKSCIRVLDGKVVLVLDPAAGDKQDILRANRNREKQYAFDFVFDPSCTQDHIYTNTTKFLIHGVLDGYNATVFAYGQTGSGKVNFNFFLLR